MPLAAADCARAVVRGLSSDRGEGLAGSLGRLSELDLQLGSRSLGGLVGALGGLEWLYSHFSPAHPPESRCPVQQTPADHDNDSALTGRGGGALLPSDYCFSGPYGSGGLSWKGWAGRLRTFRVFRGPALRCWRYSLRRMSDDARLSRYRAGCLALGTVGEIALRPVGASAPGRVRRGWWFRCPPRRTRSGGRRSSPPR